MDRILLTYILFIYLSSLVYQERNFFVRHTIIYIYIDQCVFIIVFFFFPFFYLFKEYNVTCFCVHEYKFFPV